LYEGTAIMVVTHNGPVAQYLKATGKTSEHFKEDLQKGDPAAASIFSAELLFGAIHDLIRAVGSSSPGKG
jgi:hypothetical protein